MAGTVDITGTVSTADTVPTQLGDGTVAESDIPVRRYDTTSELPADRNVFQEVNQFVGEVAANYACTGLAALVMIQEVLAAMRRDYPV